MSDDRYGSRDSSPCTDLMWFITSVIVVSAFGLSSVLCLTGTVSPFAVYKFWRVRLIDCIYIHLVSMGFIMSANLVVFATSAVYFVKIGSNDNLSAFWLVATLPRSYPNRSNERFSRLLLHASLQFAFSIVCLFVCRCISFSMFLIEINVHEKSTSFVPSSHANPTAK